MMEISQNVDLKELSTEGALLRTMSAELDSDVPPLPTPGKHSFAPHYPIVFDAS